MSIAKKIRETAEKLFGKYREGHVAPDRIRIAVQMFAVSHPQATIKDWIDFAARHAEISYEDGYTRGYERSERDPDYKSPTDEEIAQASRALEVSGLPWHAIHGGTTAEVALDAKPIPTNVERNAQAEHHFHIEAHLNEHFRNERMGRGPRRI